MVEFQAKEEAFGISWKLIGTECSSSSLISVTGNKPHKKDCQLSVGQSYRLKCEASQKIREANGWKSNYLVIENSKYCENTAVETTYNITITGNN